MSSLLRADTGNFNRFLTTLGLGLLVAAIVIPYFFFRDTDTLRISASELHQLTATGREALERRQERIADLETPVLIFAAALVVGGCISLFFGGRRLRKAQGKEDAAVDRQAQKEDYEIRRQTAAEVAAGQKAQAVENAVASAEEPALEEDRVESAPKPGTEGERGTESWTTSVQAGALARSRMEIARLETEAQRLLAKAPFAAYKYRSEVVVVTGPTPGRRIRLDGLFRARSEGRFDVVLELKVFTSPARNLRIRLRDGADQLSDLVRRYDDVTGRSARGWLVVIVAGEADGEKWNQLRDEMERLLSGVGHFTIVAEHEIGELPRLFEQTFED